MVLTSDSDDDFVSTPKDFWLFKNNKPGPSSSNKKRKKQPLKKSLTKSPATPKKKKLKLDHQVVQNNKSITNENAAEDPKTTTNNMGKSNSEPKFCSLCQMPFNLLNRWESTEVHVISCLEINFGKLPPCKEGANCDCTIRSHFTKFNHVALAEFRDSTHLEFESENNSTHLELVLQSSSEDINGSSSIEILNCSKQKEVKTPNNKHSKAMTVGHSENQNSVKIKDKTKNSDSIRFISETSMEESIKSIIQNPSQKFKFKRKDNLNSNIDSNDSEIKSASSINVVLPENKSSSSETFETPPEDNPFPENDISISRKNSITEENPVPEHDFVFSDNDDDNLFEELTNKALQINAVKDSEGGLEIKMDVDPNIKLNTITMKIPSPTSQNSNKINILGKVHPTKNKQGTLDSFFGIKPTSTSSSVVDKASSKGFVTGSFQKSRENNNFYGKTAEDRQCPFYKKIPKTTFTVDAFSYGCVPGITHYFLSHFHYDHYGGMTKGWKNGPIVCSNITAKLVLLKIKVDPKMLKVLHLNQSNIIENIEVTLLDANHCPGSVMFLFKLPNNGNVILHTGDFRACPEMEEYPELWNNRVDQLYLDTTYCKPEYDFPSQSSVISYSIDLTKKHLQKYPNTLIAVGSYTIGKERIFIALANELNCKIWGSSEKSRVLKTLGDKVIDTRLIGDPHAAKIHVVEMNKVKRKDYLQDILMKFPNEFQSILGIVPTGWTHTKGSNSEDLSTMKIKNMGHKIFQLNVPYSEHSSYGELQRFVKFLKLKSSHQILATVNVGNAITRNAQKSVFKKWIEENTQSKLSKF